MNFIERYLARANIQEIRTYIQGAEAIGEIDTRTYSQRLESGRKPLLDFLKELYPDPWEYEKKLSGILADMLGAYEDVYLEVGMKVGARMAYQLFFDDRG